MRKIEKSKIPMSAYESEDEDDEQNSNMNRSQDEFGYEEV